MHLFYAELELGVPWDAGFESRINAYTTNVSNRSTIL